MCCRLYRDVQEDRARMLEEIWSSEKDLQRHLGSDRFHTVLLAVEMATEPPEIRFDMISHTTGFETIEKVRTNPNRLDKEKVPRYKRLDFETSCQSYGQCRRLV